MADEVQGDAAVPKEYAADLARARREGFEIARERYRWAVGEQSQERRFELAKAFALEIARVHIPGTESLSPQEARKLVAQGAVGFADALLDELAKERKP